MDFMSAHHPILLHRRYIT